MTTEARSDMPAGVAPETFDAREATRNRTQLRPAADIYETEEAVVVAADMPGVSPDDVEVHLEQGVLTIRGTMPDSVHEGYRQVYGEYVQGIYERVFSLSEKIDQSKIEASQKDGVLVLVLPKAKEAQARSIKVRAG